MTNGFPVNGVGGSGMPSGNSFGSVVAGSLSDGVEIRLHPAGETLIEDVKVGTFVTIRGSRYRFFGVVTGLELNSSDSRLRHTPPDPEDPFVAEAPFRHPGLRRGFGPAQPHHAPGEGQRRSTRRSQDHPLAFLPGLPRFGGGRGDGVRAG